MPWSKDNLPPSAKDYKGKEAEIFVATANDVLKRTGDEGRAIAAGHTAVKRHRQKESQSKMAHSLFRLSETVWGQPHLIQEASLIPILEYIEQRNNGQVDFAVVPENVAAKPAPTTIGKIGELAVSGTLTYRPVMGICGVAGTSYQGLLDDAANLIAQGVNTIVMTHDSGGGQATMAFDTATELRRMADEAGVKLISYIDTMSASASYLLAVIADEVIAHPESSVGSIGAMIALTDKSKAMTNAGLKTIFITSTPGKVPIMADGSFSQAFLDKLQEDVTRLGNQFVDHVSEFTGIPAEELKALDAQMFHAEKALELGLVNRVLTHRQFAEYLQTLNGA